MLVDDLARLVGERLRAARRERGLSVGALAAAAGAFGIASQVLDTRRLEDIETTFATASRAGIDAVVVGSDTIMPFPRRQRKPRSIHTRSANCSPVFHSGCC